MDAPARPPDDPRLPQLACALDAAAMQPVFDAALRRHGAQRVMGCAVERIKYRPGRNCTVSYRLQMHDDHRGEHYEQRVAGRFCSAGEASRRHARHLARVGLASRCGVPALLVPGLELFAWFLPNDPKLAALPGLLQVARDGGAALAEALAVMTGGASEAVELKAGLVQYVPESRACGRFDVGLANGRRVRLFAKLDRDRSGASTQRVMQALYDSAARREGRLHTPRPLLWQAHTGLHWQASVPGVPLADAAPRPPSAVSASLGRTLAALHGTPVALPRRIAPDQLLGRPRECAGLMAKVDRAWGPALERLLHGLEADAATVAAQPAVTLHGDLHPRNVLIADSRLSLIDLDGACRGPAVLDLGAWIADGLYRATIAAEPLHAVQDLAAAMLASYAAASRGSPSPPLLAWATARALLCERVFSSVANLKPGRLPFVPALLALASSIVTQQDIHGSLPT